jgi:endogenous inhibitor of DNA gyrase (YacG/DUF329 family)
MPSVEHAPSPPYPIERLPCPRCGALMGLSRIAPYEPGLELMTFECPKCQHSESFIVKDN